VNISDALAQYTEALKSVSDTAHLDAECLITHISGLNKTTLFAHPEIELKNKQQEALHQQVKRRLKGEPIAYITGHKEFWDLDLMVNSDVLIPRPETECLVEWILCQFSSNHSFKVADLGVGSGAIALALAMERPEWNIHATDNSQSALNIAKMNAQKYQINNVYFFHGEWYAALPEKQYDIIVSNPPYVADDDKHLKHLSYEPIDALSGGENGLDAIKMIIHQGKDYLRQDGLLIFEHGYNQRAAILNFLKKAAYRHIQDHDDFAGLPRFSTARK